jgi:inactivated superfamily I helicase
MPDKKMLELCEKIGTEKDPKKLVALVTEPTTLLVEEQDAIKANINTNLSKGIGRAS